MSPMSPNNLYPPYNNNGNTPFPDTERERERHYLRRLFEEVERHVVSNHIPLETTCQVLGGEVRFDFGGIRVHYHPERMAHCVECFCGLHWQMSDNEFRSNSFHYEAGRIIEDFCSRVNHKYGARDDYRERLNRTYREMPQILWDAALIPPIPIPNLTLTKKAQAELDERKAEEERHKVIEARHKAKEEKRKREENKRKAEEAEVFKEILASNVTDDIKEQLNNLF